MERGADGRVSREVCEKTADGWVKPGAHFDTLDDNYIRNRNRNYVLLITEDVVSYSYVWL